MPEYTVIGFWDDSQRHVIGVIEGSHDVEGGIDPGDEGLFAELVTAEDASHAEDIVHGTTEDEEIGGDDE